MNREYVMQLLIQHKDYLVCQYGVTSLKLFGSMARDAAHEESDLDILVAFDGPVTSACYFGIQFYLEDLFGCSVDLVTEKGLRPELRPFVERDAVHV